ncbi:hypothetical protein [Mesorhizobium sp.]|uniref:hypothetical protein n=1 Tax=Mesorhizobium sp. TaxID=1871066 RepID=UPI000FE5C05F|nr:hypothetical protein [Mesorhizobium sp.]RWP25162.1 MAG: hypothetical protein EOR03_33200 [Mesorhizobium sp.]
MNLKASATGTSQLVVDAKPTVPASALSALGVTYTDKTDLVGERGNTIKITLKSVYTAGLNDAGKAAAKAAEPSFDLGPGVLYAEDHPCTERTYTAAQLASATKINSPTRR